MITTPQLQKKSKALLERCGVIAAPVDVHCIAASLGLIVREASFDSDMSGFLYQDQDQAVVGINRSHSNVRKRFTLAHEVGHHVLHQRGTTYVDRHAGPTILRRDQHSRDGTNRKEIEANSFAAELLMPVHFLERDVLQLQDTYDGDELILKLSRKYEVSAQAMTIRLFKLGYIDQLL